MNYSDSIKAILLAAINDLSKTPEKYAVKPGVDFIRDVYKRQLQYSTTYK